MGTWLRSRIASRLAVLRLVSGPRDLLLIVRMFWFASSVPLLMRQPLPQVEQLVEPRHPGRQHIAAERVDRVMTMVSAVLQAGRPLVRHGCLTRGLTLYHFLRREGLDVRLCFGIGSAEDDGDVFGDGFDGHCWLVRDGAPFLEARDPRLLYTVMWSIPSPAASMETEEARTTVEMLST